MWSQTRPTLYAGALSCVLHILLLGMAASVLVALPMQSVPQLRVTLLQRAIPLPVQELPKGGEEPQTVAPPPLVTPQTPRPKPIVPRSITEKKSVPVVPLRPQKVTAKPKRVPPPVPLPVVKEEPRQVAFTAPPTQAVLGPEPEASAIDKDGGVNINSEGTTSEFLATENLRGVPNLLGRTGWSTGKGERAGEGQGPSATPDYNINPKPAYPLIARRIGAQGEVLLRVLVREDGSVATVELARSSGFSLLDESATRTVRDNWRFIPAHMHGAPVESWVEVPIKFVLADS